MKYATAAAFLVAATGALAAPAAKRGNSTAADVSGEIPSGIPAGAGFLLPSVLANHDITSNLNTLDVQTATVRNGNIETSTLYEFYVPAELAGKRCALAAFAGRVGNGDNVLGTGQMDFFTSQIVDLAAQPSGNLRDQGPIGRVEFNPDNGLYEYVGDIVSWSNNFPCPAGKTIVAESVAVGEFDINVIKQDTYLTPNTIPNGVSLVFASA